MNLSVIGGLAAAITVLLLGIISEGQLKDFFNVASIFITVGGTFAAAFVSFPLKQLSRAFKACGLVFKKEKYNLNADINEIVRLSELARREGLLSLEAQAERTDDKFMSTYLRLVADGMDSDMLRDKFAMEISSIRKRHGQTLNVLRQCGAFSPAFGMAGTLVGLINMLVKLKESDTLGASMAVALITTLYGVLLANLVFTPLSKHLSVLSEKELTRKELLAEGLLSVQSGVNPRFVREKLNTYLSGIDIDSEEDAGFYAAGNSPRGSKNQKSQLRSGARAIDGVPGEMGTV